MKRRNKIVSMLMDKVPRRMHDGYVQTRSVNGSFVLAEIDSAQEIIDFLYGHRVFGEIGYDMRERMYNDIMAATTKNAAPGRRDRLLIKVRLEQAGNSSLHTPLAQLCTRHARMYAIVTDGQRNTKFDRNLSSSTMDAETIIELGADMPIISCYCPDDFEAVNFVYAVNGIKVE